MGDTSGSRGYKVVSTVGVEVPKMIVDLSLTVTLLGRQSLQELCWGFMLLS